MGPLIAIAVFLASMLIGSGGISGQSGSSGLPSNVTPSITPSAGQLCLPDRDIIESKKYQIANPNAITIGIPDGTKYAQWPADSIGFGEAPALMDRTNYNKALLRFYGGEPLPNGSDAHPAIDRRTKTWTMIKKDVPIPAWKAGNNSGATYWEISECVWNPSASCDTKKLLIQFEMSWIGTLKLEDGSGRPLVSDEVKSRYNSNSEAVGDIWIATGWCGKKITDPGNGSDTPDPFINQESCTDPVIKDLLFVVRRRGFGYRLGRDPRYSYTDRVTLEANPDSWWIFDVYYNFGNNTPSYNLLPCWMKTCWHPPTPSPGDVMDPGGRIHNPDCNPTT